MYRSLRSCLYFSKIPNCVVKKLLPVSFNDLKLSFIRYYKEADGKKPIARNAFSNSGPAEDVILYQYENLKFFNKLKWISLFQYIIWTCLGVSGYQLIEILPRPQKVETTNNEKLSRRFNFYERDMLQKLCIVSVVFGTGLIACIWFYIFRCVRKIILKNNGKAVLFQTYSPFKAYREFTIPIEEISGVKNRKKVKMYLPLKVYKSPFYFLLDVNGEFKNPSLFDITVALKRDFEKKNEAKKSR